MTVTMFVYGTLMTDEPLHDQWLRRSLISPPVPATVRGHRLAFHITGAYPVLVPTTRTDDVVQGEVVQLRSGFDVNDLVRMECGAGYDLSMVDARLSWVTQTVLTFTCTDPDLIGDPIASGDWRTADPAPWPTKGTAR